MTTESAKSVPDAKPPKRRRWGAPVVGLIMVAVALGLWQRQQIWVWYCAHKMETVAPENRGTWADRLVESGEAAVPTLLGFFQKDDAAVCSQARNALTKILAEWSAEDPRRAEFARLFDVSEPRFSTPGRYAAGELMPDLLAISTPGMVEKARSMIGTAVKSDSVDVRIQAVALALHPRLDSLDAVVPLLADDSADVRRAALLALGPVRDDRRAIVADDDLLRLLNDPDAEIRRLCESSLRSRGRSPRDIRLGKRYASTDPAERRALLMDLRDEEELDVSIWLERLSADADPAVRVAAIRLAGDRGVDLGGRIHQMLRSDPDPTVRWIVEYYRNQRNRR